MSSPILYIEDEEDYQLLVRRILNRAGLEVATASTAAEGLTMLHHHRPNLLLLDINLPDTDGYRLCQDLRRDPVWADLPILMLTVRRRPEEWLRGFASGANDYISKPLNPPELVERVVQGLRANARPLTNSNGAEYGLIQAAVAGNRSAFEILVQKYKNRLTESLRFMVRTDVQVEDVVSDAIATAYENLTEFRGEASFYTWLYRIAVNESIGIYRRLVAPISLDELVAEGESRSLTNGVPPESVEKRVTDSENRHLALEALSYVPDFYRQILEMYFLHDLSYGQIALKLRIPEGTVMSRLYKARKLLQESWRREHPVFGKREPALAK